VEGRSSAASFATGNVDVCEGDVILFSELLVLFCGIE